MKQTVVGWLPDGYQCHFFIFRLRINRNVFGFFKYIFFEKNSVFKKPSVNRPATSIDTKNRFVNDINVG